MSLLWFSYSGFDKDPNKSSYIYCRIPKLSIVGDYKAAGKILFLPVKNEGFANMTFGKTVCKPVY